MLLFTNAFLPSGFHPADTWGHRAPEPNKAVICSLALARLRSDVRGTGSGSAANGGGADANAVGMAQKLLLFWRKPARRCWWEGVELDGVEGVQGKLKVWIRRVWTLEMVSSYIFSSALYEIVGRGLLYCVFVGFVGIDGE